jgi:hypothetical protein
VIRIAITLAANAAIRDSLPAGSCPYAPKRPRRRFLHLGAQRHHGQAGGSQRAVSRLERRGGRAIIRIAISQATYEAIERTLALALSPPIRNSANGASA